ncbi:MAG: energy transducer TonB [Sphingomonas sp.]|nr:energy transducer TonB [Sphingomonas sp.]
MAYADQSMSTRKAVSIALVILLHAIIGYAFVTGLAYNVVKKVARDLKTFDVDEEAPPPPDKPPPPPPETKIEPPPVVAPPPIVQVQAPVAPTIVNVPVAPPPVIHATAPPAPPTVAPVRATPKGNFQSLMSTDDYPSASLRANEEGTVAYRLDVGTDGRVTGCTVTSKSGQGLVGQPDHKRVQRSVHLEDSEGLTFRRSGSPRPAPPDHPLQRQFQRRKFSLWLLPQPQVPTPMALWPLLSRAVRLHGRFSSSSS